MPLTMAREGDVTSIRRLCGKEEVRSHLKSMGFVPGTCMRVISIRDGNVIVTVKNIRVAIGREMADKIIILAG